MPQNPATPPESARGDRPDAAPSSGVGPVPPVADQFAFAAARGPRLVFVGLKTWAEFDGLDLPAHIHDWKHDKVETLLRKHQGDGRNWESRCISKAIEQPICVVFQFWEHRPEPSNADPGDEHRTASQVAA